ncbi:hypothetical protein UFOVP591_13 [uncultured Caudovirales phage]|uniref:Uncharacterized protein n=1 Tax=uncultured Caudovirales phage TaxID=2100421 RepID=A0A6J5MWP8_9CAUD|nr:hypothetical protein UFOVP591_13 [uncultured Caudovirales phage]
MKIKNLLVVIAFLLLPALAQAQSGSPFFRNDNLDAIGVANNTRSVASVSSKGEQFYLPSGTAPGTAIAYPSFVNHVVNDTTEAGTTVSTINATAHAAQVGDIVQFITAASRYGVSYVQTISANSFTIYPPLPVVPTNGDVFSIDRPAFPYLDANLSVKSGLYGPNGATAIFAEDSVHASGDNGIQVLGRQVAALGGSGATGDNTVLNTDPDGRLLVNTGPPNVANLYVCSAAATTTADTQIVAALASNKAYVTAISCSNSSAVNSIITFKRGTTAVWSATVPAMTVQAAYTMNFPNGAVYTAVNEAFNFAMTTTATSTICCVTYFYSTN